ncbi:DUF6527 family protein [Rhodanobacter sp. OR92]|uniref:DUF6527 family protein n=1 Tax=Rhodanobacter sp. OR92 TaxID=1076524 RepID=UPI0004850A82|nr:DUF6527 family protein [Rhodanobacter sp. OR92]
MSRAQIALDAEGRFWQVRINCPGCGRVHGMQTDWTPAGMERSPHIGHAQWGFNGNLDAPTFSPSIKATTGHYCNPGQTIGNCACDFQERFPDEEPWDVPCGICHSFVRDGRIQFLGDCTHALAGQTVDLPEIEGEGD